MYAALINLEDKYCIEIVDNTQTPNIVRLFKDGINLKDLICNGQTDADSAESTCRKIVNEPINQIEVECSDDEMCRQIVIEAINQIEEQRFLSDMVGNCVDSAVNNVIGADAGSLGTSQVANLDSDKSANSPIINDIEVATIALAQSSLDDASSDADKSNNSRINYDIEDETQALAQSSLHNGNVGVEEWIEVFVCHGVSPTDFYVQRNDKTDQMEEIVDRLLDGASFPELPDKTVGTLCAALFSDDSLYYRAKILSINENGGELFWQILCVSKFKPLIFRLPCTFH